MFKTAAFLLLACNFILCGANRITKKSLPNTQDKISMQPIMIIELYRHGERTPMRNYLDEDWIKNHGGGAQLTEVGMKHHYKAGQEVAKAYPDLLKNFDIGKRNDLQQLYSTETDRTIESAQARTMGLLNYYLAKDKNNSALNLSTNNSKYLFTSFNDLNKGDSDVDTRNKYKKEAALAGSYMPFSVIVKEKKHDKLFLKSQGHHACPRAANRISNASQKLEPTISKAATGLEEKIKSAGIDLTKFDTGNNPLASQISHLSDWITMYKKYFGVLPQKVTDELYKEIKIYKNMFMYSIFTDVEGSKFLTTGIAEFTKERLSKAIELKKQNENYYKYIALSAHDTTLTPFLVNLGQANYSCWQKKYEEFKNPSAINKVSSENCWEFPDVTSNILWELSHNKDKNKYYVRMLYNGKPFDLKCKNKEKLPAGYCDFSTWKEANKNYFILDGNFESFCGQHYVKRGNLNSGLQISQIIIIVILLLIITYFFMRYKTVLEVTKIQNEKSQPGNNRNEIVNVDS